MITPVLAFGSWRGFVEEGVCLEGIGTNKRRVRIAEFLLKRVLFRDMLLKQPLYRIS